MKYLKIEKLANGDVRITYSGPEAKKPVSLEIGPAQASMLAGMLQTAATATVFAFEMSLE